MIEMFLFWLLTILSFFKMIWISSFYLLSYYIFENISYLFHIKSFFDQQSNTKTNCLIFYFELPYIYPNFLKQVYANMRNCNWKVPLPFARIVMYFLCHFRQMTLKSVNWFEYLFRVFLSKIKSLMHLVWEKTFLDVINIT